MPLADDSYRGLRSSIDLTSHVQVIYRRLFLQGIQSFFTATPYIWSQAFGSLLCIYLINIFCLKTLL